MRAFPSNAACGEPKTEVAAVRKRRHKRARGGDTRYLSLDPQEGNAVSGPELFLLYYFFTHLDVGGFGADPRFHAKG